MGLSRKLPNGIEVSVEGRTQKEIFDALAMADEVFGEKCCGLCKSNDIRFAKRVVDGNDFYEMACTKCGARLSFGQSKKRPGELFPIRKLIQEGPEKGKPSRKDGSYDQSNGWTKYRGKPLEEEDDEEAPPQRRR